MENTILNLVSFEILELFIQVDAFKILYGHASCTPNHHHYLHMKDCLQDYGPIHGFWYYSFERFNRILGRYHNNNRSIEVQLMKKLLQQKDIQFQA